MVDKDDDPLSTLRLKHVLGAVAGKDGALCVSILDVRADLRDPLGRASGDSDIDPAIVVSVDHHGLVVASESPRRSAISPASTKLG